MRIYRDTIFIPFIFNNKNNQGIAVNPNYSLTNRSNMMLHGHKTLSYYAVQENESLLLGTDGKYII